MNKLALRTHIGREALRTAALTAEEFGAYERLRRHFWLHLTRPSEAHSRVIAGIDPDRWDAVYVAIEEILLEQMRVLYRQQKERTRARKRQP